MATARQVVVLILRDLRDRDLLTGWDEMMVVDQVQLIQDLMEHVEKFQELK